MDIEMYERKDQLFAERSKLLDLEEWGTLSDLQKLRLDAVDEELEAIDELEVLDYIDCSVAIEEIMAKAMAPCTAELDALIRGSDSWKGPTPRQVFKESLEANAKVVAAWPFEIRSAISTTRIFNVPMHRDEPS